jgi:hypothetical protein
MKSLEKSWYKKLLMLAPVIGVAGGVLALVFMGITGTANDLLFGDTGTGWWTGRWWWIPLTALGGLVVTLLRKTWKISKHVPGAIELAQQAWVDPGRAFYWVAISTVSLVTGASLGPSFGLAVMGGGFGSWVVTRLRRQFDDVESRKVIPGNVSQSRTGQVVGQHHLTARRWRERQS